ncbi:MAG: uracil phosphoribosyltransferase [Oligoflexales bacterium]|nr:uracil phosphoribosyltransferase [Oligoflexales bacterium]
MTNRNAANRNVKVIDHPLVQHKLTLMRMKETSTDTFRNLMKEVSVLLGYEVTRKMPLSLKEIETPITRTTGYLLEKKKLALIPILRAGLGLLDGMLQLLPTAKVGHIGLYRTHTADDVVEYYYKLPEDITMRDALVLDPMLATGQSAVAAVTRIKEAGPKSVEFVCLLASQEGLDYFHSFHPDVVVYTAAIDAELNSHKYIVPGLGDAGDRLYGTR